jgi:hypothetical protein
LNAQVEQKKSELQMLCRQYGVQRLALFGSALREDFDQMHSDLDFLVEFQPLPPGSHAEAYFGLLEGLERLFHRPIDLVVESAIKNPYFREGLLRGQTSLYAA